VSRLIVTLSRPINAVKTLVVRTDVRRWARVAGEVPPWDSLNKKIATFIPDGSSVLDLGAGAQTLRAHLPSACFYQPCDIIISSPDIIYCDFNSGEYPVVQFCFDYAVCSGLLEYIRKPEEFLRIAGGYGRNLILSYNLCRKGETTLDRLAKGWVNHLSLQQLMASIGAAGLAPSVLQEGAEMILLCRQPVTFDHRAGTQGAVPVQRSSAFSAG